MSEKLTCPYCGGNQTEPDTRMPKVFRCIPCDRLWKEDSRISVDVSRIRALEAEVEAANRQRSRSNAAVVIAQEALEVAVPDADMRNALIVQVDEIQSLRARLAALEERAIPDYAEAHFRRLMEDEAEQADPETEPPFSWRLAWKWLNGLETDTPEVEPA